VTQAKPIIVGCEGPQLSREETALFAAERPAGLILFERNCSDPAQLSALTAAFREAVDSRQAPVLIDQEGGRVARLKPPHWHALPPAAVFGRMAERDFVEAAAALQLAFSIAAEELRGSGITVNCAPVLDLPAEGADPIIGDRAFSDDPALVSRLGRVAVDTLRDSGVLPVIKHIPGHGRAPVDSHRALPRIDADMDTLCETDIVPFRAMSDAPFAMTAHVVFEAIDKTHPATQSSSVIGEFIRGTIGFEGLLMSDDIGMDALEGAPAERAKKALAAGCDLVISGSGDIVETRAVLEGTEPMARETGERLVEVCGNLGARAGRDIAAAYERLQTLLGAWA